MNINRNSLYKSRGEREIAGFLEGQKINFQYEYPLAINDRGKTRIWYPDFTLPDYNTIVEYFGMMGNKSYNEQMAHKTKAYQNAGIDGIYLVESSLQGDWQGMFLERIEQNLEGKLRKIRHQKAGYESENLSKYQAI